ncbi:hypothetical protein SORBI_3006G215200 [Sorghum bicolor]|uniref:Uncharacterized protein n=1 Tax=Sorghum bicolor TaxID=4558 RepID=A0A1Z5REY6_SORBI|nr:hypothetical protein SORBI_3006G215200 [Sorghum bicolor]
MGMEAKCGGLAVAASAAVRRPLQPRDTNVAASTVVVGKKTAAPTPRAHPKAGAGTRPGPPAAAAAALPSLPLFPAQCGVSVAAAGVAEVSLAEELEKARERAARRISGGSSRSSCASSGCLRRRHGGWQVYTPVESLRSKEERKRRGATIAHSGSTGSISTASELQADDAAGACSDEESEVTGGDNRDGKNN